MNTEAARKIIQDWINTANDKNEVVLNKDNELIIRMAMTILSQKFTEAELFKMFNGGVKQ